MLYPPAETVNHHLTGAGEFSTGTLGNFQPVLTDKANLTTLHRSLRVDLHYINGAQTLWYLKADVPGPTRLGRFPLSITLAAMHRLSEICRYRPIELSAFLAGRKNWLLSEFIHQAPNQFIDELAAEITGHQFMTPNVRIAT
ncbi:MAG: YaaC family protein [Bryobacterales bacterium]|nr:YaaC family protein [Bryobacterales bacterium]